MMDTSGSIFSLQGGAVGEFCCLKKLQSTAVAAQTHGRQKGRKPMRHALISLTSPLECTLEVAADVERFVNALNLRRSHHPCVGVHNNLS